jgi:hypothetical protein
MAWRGRRGGAGFGVAWPGEISFGAVRQERRGLARCALLGQVPVRYGMAGMDKKIGRTE